MTSRRLTIWFIDKLAIIVEMENALKNREPLTADLLKEAKRIEFPDNVIARLTGVTEDEIKEMRHAQRHPRSLQDGRYLCGRVRSRDSLLLFLLRQ